MMLTLFFDPIGFLKFKFKSLIQDKSNRVGVYKFNHALKLELNHRYDLALRLYNELITDYNDSSQLLYHRGFSKLNLGLSQEALVDFDNAISINPFYSEAYNQRATCKRNLGLFQEAIADNDKAIELNIGNYEYYFNRAATREKINNLEGAFDDYNMAVYFNMYHALSYINKGKIHFDLGNLDRAELELRKGGLLDPTEETAQRLLGIIYFRKKEFRKAKKYLVKAKDLGNPESQNELTQLITICQENEMANIIGSEEKVMDRYTRLSFPY